MFVSANMAMNGSVDLQPGVDKTAKIKQRLLFTMVQMGPGGVESNVLNLLHLLDPNAYALSLFLHHAPGAAAGSTQPGRTVPDHVQVSWALRSRYRRFKLPWMLVRLLREARHCDVIIAAQEGRATLLAWLAGKLLRKPVVSCIQFDWGAFRQHTRRRQVMGLKWMCPRVDKLVVCGEGALTSLQQLVRLDPRRVALIPNFVASETVRHRGKGPRPAWSEQVFCKPTVVSMGRFAAQKDLGTLIRAHACLKSKGIDHHLLLLGDGDERQMLESLVNDLGVSKSVFMPGYVADPFPLLAGGDVFALSSRFEGLPFAMIEAMTLGLPVVATDCPSGPHEVLEAGRYGLLVPVNDPPAMGDAIGQLLASDPLRALYSAKSIIRAEAYSEKQALSAWQRVIAST